MRRAPPLTCHCEAAGRRGNLAGPGWITGRSGEIVTAFPRLHPKGTSSRFALRAPVGLRPPRNDNSGAFTILTSVCTSR